MTPEEMLEAALEVAERGLAAGELPIGAVVFMGEEIVGSAFTQEVTLGRRLVHADLLAMAEADQHLGWTRRPRPLVLAVTLEPCLMCVGAAMAMGIEQIVFALESPGDGAAAIASGWPTHPDMPSYVAPDVRGGISRERSRGLFQRYVATAADSPMVRWAQSLADLP